MPNTITTYAGAEFNADDQRIIDYAKQYGFVVNSITRSLDGTITVNGYPKANTPFRTVSVSGKYDEDLRGNFHALVGYPEPVEDEEEEEDEFGNDDEYYVSVNEADEQDDGYMPEVTTTPTSERAELEQFVARYAGEYERANGKALFNGACNCGDCVRYRSAVERLAELDNDAERLRLTKLVREYEADRFNGEEYADIGTCTCSSCVAYRESKARLAELTAQEEQAVGETLATDCGTEATSDAIARLERRINELEAKLYEVAEKHNEFVYEVQRVTNDLAQGGLGLVQAINDEQNLRGQQVGRLRERLFALENPERKQNAFARFFGR